MAIETFFGYGILIEYGIGDRVAWHTGKSIKHGRRPKHGDLDGEGYTVCPCCHRNFFLKVHVRSDIMKGVEPDLAKAPYIKDKGKSAWAADAACARRGATLQGFCTTSATSEETQGV